MDFILELGFFYGGLKTTITTNKEAEMIVSIVSEDFDEADFEGISNLQNFLREKTSMEFVFIDDDPLPCADFSYSLLTGGYVIFNGVFTK